MFLFFSGINHCFDKPCRNNGKCTSSLHEFKCECSVGFKGLMCEGRNRISLNTYYIDLLVYKYLNNNNQFNFFGKSLAK